MSILVDFKRILYLNLFYLLAVAALAPKDVVFVILSQENKYHVKLAENLSNNIQQQSHKLYKDHPVVHLSHADFPHVGSWIILPLIPRLISRHKNNSSWIFFLEDRTKIRLELLLDALAKYDPKTEIWIGNALRDEDATVIHHYAFYEDPKFFKYPNIGSGFAISIPLLERLSRRMKEGPGSRSDFSIDSAHELAMFIWNHGDGHMLQHDSALCNRDMKYCASFPIPFEACGPLVPKSSIYFAVKTCSRFHSERIPVVKNTWGPEAATVKYFSDLQDDSIPTIDLGIPNSENGHCMKTTGIMKFVAEDIKSDPIFRWIVIADDDTILSVPRIRQLLTCYDDSEELSIGERYGFNVKSPRGYNYITGGGGMVFSRPLLKKLLLEGVCVCPDLTTPDDMFLGICMARLNATVIHVPFFHQARPVDYAAGYLETEDAVSFHKHWMIDPIKVYEVWLKKGDTFTTFSKADDLNMVHNDHNEL